MHPEIKNIKNVLPSLPPLTACPTIVYVHDQLVSKITTKLHHNSHNKISDYIGHQHQRGLGLSIIGDTFPPSLPSTFNGSFSKSI